MFYSLIINSCCCYFYNYIVIHNFLGTGVENVISSSKDTVYRGSKGSFHRKQQHPRASRLTNWVEYFTTHHCGGSAEECIRVLNRFQLLNNTATKTEANGMLAVFVEQGAKETLLREVFGIGSARYLKILHNKADKIGGGKNGNAVSEEMLDQLHRFASHGVPTEYGYPCGHRRLLKYCTDPGGFPFCVDCA